MLVVGEEETRVGAIIFEGTGKGKEAIQAARVSKVPLGPQPTQKTYEVA
jgi:hypothetical protein